MGNVIVSNITRTPVENGSNWGSVASVSDTALFADDFSSGDLSYSANGFAWGGSDNVVVSTDNPRTGSHSLKFTHGTGSKAEQRFYMGALRSDITQEFYLYIPDGTETWGGITYEHYNEDGGGDNNKFMRLWDSSGYASAEKVGSSMGTSTETGLSSNYAEWDSGTGVTWQGFDTAEQNFINAADRGTWIKIKTYHKSATVANNDGIVKFYKNDVLLYSRTTVDNYHASGDHAWSDGYLLGSASGHFPAGELMHLFIDGYKLWEGEA